MEQPFDYVVIGGGAAGFFSAIRAAELNPDLRIAILEKGSRVLSKVKVSGGGRCNVTHAQFDPAKLIENYPRGGRELRGPFHQWQPRDMVAWMEEKGVRLKAEEDGRMFPVSDSSQTIIDLFEGLVEKYRISLYTNCPVFGLTVLKDKGFQVEVGDELIEAKNVLVAAGGLKRRGLGSQLEYLGHKLIEAVPSLFTFHIEDRLLLGLEGITFQNATVSIVGSKQKQSGPILITHIGLSGPGILKLSAWAARELAEVDYRFDLLVDWVPEFSPEDLKEKLQQMRNQFGSKKVKNQRLVPLAQRFWESLLYSSGIDQDSTWSQVSKLGAKELCRLIKSSKFEVTGKSTNKEEFVTCGGVSLKEVNFKTMESKLVPGLHFAGECLDIDGVTGGFNFQAAWTTAELCARSVSGEA